MKAKIKIKNGYWTYNGVPVKNCSFPIQTLVASFIKAQMFNEEVKSVQVSRPTEIDLGTFFLTTPTFIPVQ
jgi:hypothetical protein